ncbi:hypothetical protein K488DRAFT_88800 [Vararia minispora EC-137]|uniref:Uncharacterized protein n=1 Tax=Vararia minispora EC-137 TaxID=1314806 RepID=A0ACB8QC56_9AGAM|nr:hypothetical protein K488DRAFT_88800 [Vararia minispora EC-137]
MSYYNNFSSQNQMHYQTQHQDTYYDPYASAGQREPYPSYDQGGYRDDYYQDAPRAAADLVTHEKDQPFKVETFGVTPRPNPNMKRFKYERDGLWTRGGGLRSCGRFLCCTLLIGVWMLVGIILALVLYLRPPNVVVGTAQLPSSNQVQSISGGGIRINVEIPITVSNPSYLSIYYPINNTFIGNGTLKNTPLPSFSNKSFDFPFSLDYTSSIDPQQTIITDIVTKCAAKQDLTVRYDLTVGVRVLGVTVSPSVSNNVSFTCPLDTSSLSNISGLNLSSIISGLTGSG